MKKLFLKFCKIYWKTPVPDSLFNKVAGLQSGNFIKKRRNFVKKRLQHRYFPVNIAKFL